MAGNSENVLVARNITKRFLSVTALDHVDFTLRQGEVHALLGENGAGKSTLVKCLTGAYRRDEGEIRLDGQSIDPRDTLHAQTLGIGTVYQEVNLLPNLTVAENIFLGRQPTRFGMVRNGEMRRRARELLSGYGLDIDVSQLLSAYSVAVQQIIAIARAVDLSGKVLILDEPTASLDAHEVDLLFGIIERLKARGLGIIFITHFLEQVYRITDRVTILRNGELVGTEETATLSRQQLVSMMLGRELNDEEHEHAEVTETGPARFVFKNVGRKGAIAPFDLEIARGEVVGFAGLLGSGRTETADLMFGTRPADTGTITIDGEDVAINSPRAAIDKGFGYCPEDRKTDGIVGDLSIRENIILALQAKRGWARPLRRSEQNALADKFIAALDIRTDGREKPIKLLSGGNQQKVLLARWLATDPQLLILDEPTRGIDVGAHAEIIRLIRELCAEGMSLAVISSEIEELVAYCTRVRVLRDRRHVAELDAANMSASNIIQAIAASPEEERA